MNSKIDNLTQILKESNNIVFFGGAVMSTESNNKFLINKKATTMSNFNYLYL